MRVNACRIKKRRCRDMEDLSFSVSPNEELLDLRLFHTKLQ